MKLEDVRRRVQEIAEDAGDDESQHSAEDALHQDVLARIARGWGGNAGDVRCLSGDDMAELAEAALETKKIEFARHCA